MSEVKYTPHIPEIKTIENDLIFETFGMGSRLNLLNNLGIGRIGVFIQNFDAKTNKETNRCTAFIKIPEALLLANDILSGKYASLTKNVTEGESEPVFINYGGTDSEKAGRADHKPVCRCLTLTRRNGKWSLRIAEGAGKKTATNGFIFDGKAEKIVYIGMNDDTLKQMALMIQNECLAYRVAQLCSLNK